MNCKGAFGVFCIENYKCSKIFSVKNGMYFTKCSVADYAKAYFYAPYVVRYSNNIAFYTNKTIKHQEKLLILRKKVDLLKKMWYNIR